jgi:hypothetical protein
METATLDRWFARVAETYPGETGRFLSGEPDRFRNPAGHLLRENLAVLLREILGGMDPASTKPALAAVVRLRAVQELTATQAVGFIFTLRTIMDETMPGLDRELISRRIDQLALMAFEEYVGCRERISEIRINEGRRAMAVSLSRARS